MSAMKLNAIINSNWVTVLFLIVGAAFFLLGIWREEYTIVMEKAINICLECVGIG